MLYFNLVGNNEIIAKLTLEELEWLTRMNVIRDCTPAYSAGDDPDPETLPPFDAFELTLENIVSMKQFSAPRIEEMNMVPGFGSVTVDKFVLIIETALRMGTGVEVDCD
jgi:hypothetical protein